MTPTLIPFPRLELIAYGENWDFRTEELVLEQLARAIAVSRVWGTRATASLVVKLGDPPTATLIGYLEESVSQRFQLFLQQLQTNLNLVRYLSYSEVELVCAELAAELAALLKQESIPSVRVVAIPRGGYIVLGMLSYLLGLQSEQLEHSSDQESVLVVVDDCALTGARFRQFLDEFRDRKVIFAPLLSHPELRRSIIDSEEQVLDVISGRDLHDFGPELMGEQYKSWRERWDDRYSAPRPYYWLGRTEIPCFPWSEPDNSFWNPLTNRVDDGWNYVPPEYCLKHRSQDYVSPVQVVVQTPGNGFLQPPEQVIFAIILGDVILIGNLATSEIHQLEGVAAAMWLAILDSTDLDEAVEALQSQFDVEQGQLAADLSRFVDQLKDRGLLEDSRSVISR